jgi:2-polyprenyl-3-methyl-5-hydroxy-6-metoxy-1,4-benzoquinol methylase
MSALVPAPAEYVARSCSACGSLAEPEQLYEKWGYAILRCPDCGLGSTCAGDFDPARIYSRDYFSGGRSDGYADYVGSEAVLRKESRRVLRALADAGCSSGTLLEIGCAYGFFLAEASKTFEVEGIELCQDAAAFCRSRGLNVASGAANAETLGSGQPIDAVVMLDVIEHLADPLSVLKLVNARLKVGGHLLLTTGDWDSILSRFMKSSWRLITPPQHLFFFSRTSLSAMLKRTGFQVVEVARPAKLVPAGLMVFQMARILGAKPPVFRGLSGFALPTNLFDALRIIGVKDRSI